MHVVLLRFSANKAQAPQHMSGHRDWIRKGVDEGVFLLVGSIRPGQGGAILAVAPSSEALAARIDEDPFVVHDIVTAEVINIDPNLTDPRLSILAG